MEIYLPSSSPEYDGRKQLSQPEHIYLYIWCNTVYNMTGSCAEEFVT